MESIYPELALCGRKNKCARTDTAFLPMSEVSEGTVSCITFSFKCDISLASRAQKMLTILLYVCLGCMESV